MEKMVRPCTLLFQASELKIHFMLTVNVSVEEKVAYG